jgi:hypothetical protein
MLEVVSRLFAPGPSMVGPFPILAPLSMGPSFARPFAAALAVCNAASSKDAARAALLKVVEAIRFS